MDKVQRNVLIFSHTKKERDLTYELYPVNSKAKTRNHPPFDHTQTHKKRLYINYPVGCIVLICKYKGSPRYKLTTNLQ